MNKQMTYEITIKKKLENIPVPDLSEMIWARIESELDNDPGDIPDKDPTSPSSPAGGIMLGGTALIFIIALFFYFLNDKTNDIPKVEKVQTTLPVQNVQSKLPEANSNAQSEIKQENKKQENIAGTHLQEENSVPLSPTIVNDSIPEPGVVSKNENLLILPKTMDTLAPKKTRGVTGISNDDYKIVPKRDSSGN